VALLSYGTRLSECQAAAAELESEGLSVTIADARFAKPLDTALVNKLIQNHKLVVTVEEGAQGGFGAIVLQHAAQAGLLDSAKNAKLRCLTLPDLFQDHDAPAKQYAAAKLDAASIADAVRRAL
jgi:1-deoxy-D-xylulose-5-phosphate synthase